MGRFATTHRRQTSVRQTTNVQNLRQGAAENSSPASSEKDVARKFAKLVIGYSKNDLADISGRTPEAAKHWKEASRAPNTASLFKIGRQIDAVREWAANELGIEIQRPAPGAEKGAAAIAMLQAIALMGGEAGAMAKASLAALQAGGN